MWKAALAGAIALVTLGSFSISDKGFGIAPASAQEMVVTEGNIARLRNALRLTPAQEVHWRSLEATLRSLGQRARTEEAGMIQRVGARIKGYVLDASAASRVASAAQPLIATLDEQQRTAGMAVMRSMGAGSLF